MLNNLRILFILIVIGLLTHFQTLKFGLFGDDWLAIYWYLSQEITGTFLNNLPGLLKYLTPYGGLVFLTGVAYDLFGSNYSYYYLVSLIFKITASFSLFLLIKSLADTPLKRRENFIPLLGSILFLVGLTGIQTTDFIVHMGVFLASTLSFLSIYYLNRAIKFKSSLQVLICLSLATFSIILVPIRFVPFIIVFPISCIILFWIYKSKGAFLFASIILLTWTSVIFVLWMIGLISTPGQISPVYTSTLKNFISILTSNPIHLSFTLFQWIGVTIIPDQFIGNKNIQALIGFLFISFSIATFYMLRKEKRRLLKLLVSAIPLIFFFISMFIYSSNRFMSSENRYLIMIFYGFCLFFTVAIINLSISTKRLAKVLYPFLVVFLITLVIIHFVSLQKLYKLWLINGRSADFIIKTERLLIEDFKDPIDSNKIIYLDFDNSKTLYFIQYGLDFKLLILTNTLNRRHWPIVTIDQSQVTEAVKTVPFDKRQETINNIHSYSFKNGVFFRSTQQLRDTLKIENDL